MYPDNDEKAADVPDSTLTNRQANALLAQQAERRKLNEGEVYK